MYTLVFATNNPHKAREVEQILGEQFSVKTLRDIGCFDEIEETEPTLEGNALRRQVGEKR
ncbi:MAG TPA: non-canonical purine NTP pyrophosphatase [Saprospiraceae bacterium]|nr:non-canonical purine NTP pyrophosphatase [Saprospiraceae bacterium]